MEENLTVLSYIRSYFVAPFFTDDMVATAGLEKAEICLDEVRCLISVPFEGAEKRVSLICLKLI